MTMNTEDGKRKGSPAGCSGQPSYDPGCQSLRRVSDGIYASADFTVMAFFTERVWLLKVQGVTIGRFKTIQEIMDFIDTWVLGE
jgi:hypothetical protein